MTSHDNDILDFNKLQKELDAAVEQDARYWRENDAKIRAVSTQRVATYEEFKDLVAGSHLKPLNKGDHLDTIKEISKQPWNPAASRTKQNTGPHQTQQQISQGEMKIPKNGQEFARDWQRHIKSPEQRYAYLLNCGSDHLTQIFKTEVSFGLLGDILAALLMFVKEDVKIVLDILCGLKASSRFALSLQFLTSKEKDVCTQLFEQMAQVMKEEGLSELAETTSVLKSEYLPL